MIPRAKRPRPGITPIIATILRAFDDWEIEAKHPDAEMQIDYSVEFIYIGAGGRQQEVTREHFEGKGAYGDAANGDDTWPRPGKYEIHILDSNNEDVIEPFRAEHYSKDAIITRNEDSGAALMQALQEESRISVRDSQARRIKAEQAEEKARDALRQKDEQLAKTLHEVSVAKLAQAKAEADRELAIGLQKAAEEELEELRRETSEWKPQIAMAVDHLVYHVRGAFGFQEPANGAAEQQQQEAADEERPVQFTPPEGETWDPPPPGAEYPNRRANEFFEELLFNPHKLKALVENGFITWELARALIYLKRKVDPGASPQWEEWCRLWNEANAEPRAAE